jgi:hypothetical protein
MQNIKFKAIVRNRYVINNIGVFFQPEDIMYTKIQEKNKIVARFSDYREDQGTTWTALLRKTIQYLRIGVSVALPATIKSLAEDYHSKLLTLRIEILCLSKTKDRLANADFVPATARIKFYLTASAREKADEESKALAERTDSAVEFNQNSIKIELSRLVDLEIKHAKEALQLHFCKSVAAS